jgi:hypothetical protein
MRMTTRLRALRYAVANFRRRGVEIGRGDRIRTCDLLVPNQALYQAKLHPGQKLSLQGIVATRGSKLVFGGRIRVRPPAKMPKAVLT